MRAADFHVHSDCCRSEISRLVPGFPRGRSKVRTGERVATGRIKSLFLSPLAV
jgi:hypothetical protein